MTEYAAIGWHESVPRSTYIAHIAGEFSRLGIDKYSVPFGLTGVWLELLGNTVNSSALGLLLSSGALDIRKHVERIQNSPEGLRYGPMPQAKCRMNITKRDNLSVVWHPTGIQGDSGEWVREPIRSQAPHSRPENEIVFVREITRLRPRRNPTDDRAANGLSLLDANLIISDLVCCVRSLVEEAISLTSSAVEIERLNGFDFVLSNDGRAASDFPTVSAWQIGDKKEMAPYF
jgi:hypothetical protein